MKNKIVVISEKKELSRTIEEHLKGQFDLVFRSYSDLDEDESAVLYIFIAKKLSYMGIKTIQYLYTHVIGPILFISGQKDPQKRIYEKVEVIEKGADEYLPDTQTLEEIEASVKALIRRNFLKEHGDAIFVGRDFKINPVCREIIAEGKRIDLTKKEFDIVYYLALNANKAVTFKELYEGVWKKEYLCDDKNIMAHIHRIRKKLEKDPKNPEYIQSVYGVGYCFVDSKNRKKADNTQYIEKEIHNI